MITSHDKHEAASALDPWFVWPTLADTSYIHDSIGQFARSLHTLELIVINTDVISYLLRDAWT